MNYAGINIDKCKILIFNFENSNIKFDYMLNNISIKSFKSFIDLEGTFDSKLCFNTHIKRIPNKAFLNLSFISRTFFLVIKILIILIF